MLAYNPPYIPTHQLTHTCTCIHTDERDTEIERQRENIQNFISIENFQEKYSRMSSMCTIVFVYFKYVSQHFVFGKLGPQCGDIEEVGL